MAEGSNQRQVPQDKGKGPEVVARAPQEPRILTLEELSREAKYQEVWQKLKLAYLEWEVGRAMDNSDPTKLKLCKEAVFRSRKNWQVLTKEYGLDDKKIMDWLRPSFKNGTVNWNPNDLSIKGFFLRSEEDQAPVGTSQPQATTEDRPRKRSKHFHNDNRHQSDRSDAKAYVRAQVMMGQTLLQEEGSNSSNRRRGKYNRRNK
ncbi:uncharacterized protein MELLADRAFT_58262 [Melampsora larici-populina 98AG31]|uniref:Uncharacterized protein n=1 Tax=Melampsora larici-populina (strain 98AG31 / pathotype 3-4-7) TaxID=747676 RepID=F4SDX1_MELLP|nr:uncharacterized protein MELLADRAFT_58262 [Melampsora larici-populina 98AG31]EGF97155.1 hypothetical protein MELLADRAFT_58262 [Melampsora larici-populina 98AG31]